MSERMVLFVDAQNMYMGARRRFFHPADHHTCGQFDPVEMLRLLCSQAPGGHTYVPEGVRVYTGQPVSGKDPKGYGASRKHHAFWRKQGAEVIARPLRYPLNFPRSKPEEKGIDVQLAIDFVSFAIDGRFDVGVIASTDTDLVPAMDFVSTRFPGTRTVQVASWSSGTPGPRLQSRVKRVWCHYLSRNDYDSICDNTNYAI